MSHSLEGEPNRVPAEPIRLQVRDYLNQQIDLSQVTHADGHIDAGPLTILALRVDVDESTLRKFVEGGTKTIDFDLADRLLCKMGRVDAWTGALAPVYQQVVLVDGTTSRKPARKSGAKICEGFECSVEFVPGARTPWQRFCSESCKRKAYWKRRREREGAKPRFGTRYGHCPNGHERTPENTHTRKNGSISCKACGREKEAARYQNDPEYRQRRIEASRRRREELRNAA